MQFSSNGTVYIGVGTGGREGSSAPTARAMPVHAVIGLTMRYHNIKFQE